MIVLFFYDYIETLGNYSYFDPSSDVNILLPNIYTDDQSALGNSIQQPFEVYRPGRE